jgi:hypothetical protein
MRLNPERAPYRRLTQLSFPNTLCFAMPVKSIQLGQVWRNDQTSQNYLVTKVYNEVFTQYAMLRQADAQAANVDTIRVKVQKTSDGATLPGYTFTQESHDF